MRVLSQTEINYVAGGDYGSTASDIVVNGHRDHSSDDDDDPLFDEAGSGGGSDSSDPMTPYQAAEHNQECSKQSGAAVQIAHHVMGQDGNQQVTTSTGHNWNQVEFSAVIVSNGDNKFGAMNSQIYSSDNSGSSAIPSNMPSNAVGIWHNHPLRGDEATQRLDMFPSRGDWDDLQVIADQTADKNPSLYLTDGHGVTREFALSDKAKFYNMTNSQLASQESQDLLKGRDRTQHC